MNSKNFLLRRQCIVLLLCIATCIVALARDPFNFRAACLNVDGLPQKIYSFDINPKGPGSEGSKAISQAIKAKNWDFMSFSEDFNYHDEVTSSLKDDYYIGTHRGEIAASTLISTADTDGLCFLSKKIYPDPMASEKWVMWNDRVGDLSHGADEKIKKGFRYYLVDFGNGYQVDVYVTHMNSEDSPEAIAAKENEMRQFVKYILDTDNKRPIIFMGDTNCRYTREKLKELLVDAINADDRFYMKDPWVEIVRNGLYPMYGGPIISVNDLGNQKGEVVDKVFYINNRESGVELVANSYLHDDSFVDANGNPLADHFPIVIDFTLRDKEYDLLKPLGPEETVPGEYEGTYYLQNTATGKFFGQGNSWGTQAITNNVGIPITFTTLGNGYQMKSNLGFITADDESYVDGGSDHEFREWKITKTHGGFIIGCDAGKYLGITNAGTGAIGAKTTDNLDMYVWKLIKREERFKELGNASPINPLDASFTMGDPRFDNYNSGDWTFTPLSNASVTINGWVWDTDNSVNEQRNWGIFCTSKAGLFNSNNTNWTISKTIDNLPDGKYSVAFDYISSVPASITFKLNGEEKAASAIHDTSKKCGGSDTYNNAWFAIKNSNGNCHIIAEDIIINNGSLSIEFSKGKNSGSTATFIDNFEIIYYGPADISIEELRDEYKVLYAEAEEIMVKKMGRQEKEELKAKMVDPASLSTNEEIINAANNLRLVLEKARGSVLFYTSMKSAINNMKELVERTNVYTKEAYDDYMAIATRYDDGTLTGNEQDPYAVTGWHADVDVAPLLLSSFGFKGFEQALYINTWSVEGNSDGSEFVVPFFEYWTNEGGNTLGAKTWTATQTGLIPDKTYKLSVWARVAPTISGNMPQGIKLQVGDGTPVDITAGTPVDGTNFYLAEYEAYGTADANGNLYIKYIVEEGNNVHWLSFKNMFYSPMSNVTVNIEEGWDTLILPFEADKPIDLNLYTATEYSEKKEKYHTLKLVQDNSDKILANTPYIVEYQPSTIRRIHRINSVEETGNGSMNITFEGFPSNTQTEYTQGVLTGTHVGHTATNSDYVLVNSNGIPQFSLNMDESGNTSVPATKVYIKREDTDNAPSLIALTPELGLQVGIDLVIVDDPNAPVDIYTTSGIQVKRGVEFKAAFEGLVPGIYIVCQGIHASKVTVR